MADEGPASESRVMHAALKGSAELERRWTDTSDDALEKAAQDLASYTEEGQRVILAELQRRSIQVPDPETEEEARSEPLELGRGVRIYTGPVLANLAIVRDVLESYGIECETRREYLGGAAGELPPIETWPELWIFDESRVEQARQLVQEVIEPPKASTAGWICPGCREEVESQFSACWNCGTERPSEAGS